MWNGIINITDKHGNNTEKLRGPGLPFPNDSWKGMNGTADAVTNNEKIKTTRFVNITATLCLETDLENDKATAVIDNINMIIFITTALS